MDMTLMDSYGNTADSYGYSGFGEVTSYSAAHGSTGLYTAQYTRDTLGRITEKTETIGGTATTLDYNYDLAGRLTDVMQNGTVTAHYDYDANGSRAGGFTSTLGAILSTSYGNQDRLLTYETFLGGAATYAYTANGELLTKTDGSGVAGYVYDALGNLRSVTLPSGDTIAYVIDGNNRRIGKAVNGVLVGGWLYDGQLRIVAELDGSNSVVSRFVYGAKVNAPDYMVRGGATYRLIADHLGSVRLVADATSGAIVQRMDYDEFGNVSVDYIEPGWQPVPFGFAGGLYDRDTKLVRSGARDYDAETGRWTAKDPIGFRGGSANLYNYVLEDPVNLRDSDGRSLFGAALGAIFCGGLLQAHNVASGIHDVRDFVAPLEDQVRRIDQRIAAIEARLQSGSCAPIEAGHLIELENQLLQDRVGLEQSILQIARDYVGRQPAIPLDDTVTDTICVIIEALGIAAPTP